MLSHRIRSLFFVLVVFILITSVSASADDYHPTISGDEDFLYYIGEQFCQELITPLATEGPPVSNQFTHWAERPSGTDGSYDTGEQTIRNEVQPVEHLPVAHQAYEYSPSLQEGNNSLGDFGIPNAGDPRNVYSMSDEVQMLPRYNPAASTTADYALNSQLAPDNESGVPCYQPGVARWALESRAAGDRSKTVGHLSSLQSVATAHTPFSHSTEPTPSLSSSSVPTESSRQTEPNSQSDKAGLVCDICKSTWKTPSARRKHERNHAPPEQKPYRCKKCPEGKKAFLWPKDLSRHDDTHFPPTIHCPYNTCPYSEHGAKQGFRRRGNLQKHMAKRHASSCPSSTAASAD